MIHKFEFTVLIVEDDVTFAAVIQDILRYSFDTRICYTLTDAKEVLANHSINAVLLDVTLPNGSGKDIVIDLRQRFTAVPIVAMSGYDFSANEMIAVGAHDFLRKPFTSEQLIEKLVNTISRNKAWERISPILTDLRPTEHKL